MSDSEYFTPDNLPMAQPTNYPPSPPSEIAAALEEAQARERGLDELEQMIDASQSSDDIEAAFRDAELLQAYTDFDAPPLDIDPLMAYNEELPVPDLSPVRALNILPPLDALYLPRPVPDRSTFFTGLMGPHGIVPLPLTESQIEPGVYVHRMRLEDVQNLVRFRRPIFYITRAGQEHQTTIPSLYSQLQRSQAGSDEQIGIAIHTANIPWAGRRLPVHIRAAPINLATIQQQLDFIAPMVPRRMRQTLLTPQPATSRMPRTRLPPPPPEKKRKTH